MLELVLRPLCLLFSGLGILLVAVNAIQYRTYAGQLTRRLGDEMPGDYTVWHVIALWGLVQAVVGLLKFLQQRREEEGEIAEPSDLPPLVAVSATLGIVIAYIVASTAVGARSAVEKNVELMRSGIGAYQLILFLAAPVAMAWLAMRQPLGASLQWLGIQGGRPRHLPVVLAAAMCWIVAAMQLSALGEAIFPPSAATRAVYQKLMAVTNPGEWPLVLFWIALVPAICEETLFRGLLFRSLLPRMQAGSAVAITATAFAIVHFQPASFLPTLAIGIVLAVVALRTGTLFHAMLIHALFNGAAVWVANATSKDFVQIGNVLSLPLLLASLVAGVFSMMAFFFATEPLAEPGSAEETAIAAVARNSPLYTVLALIGAGVVVVWQWIVMTQDALLTGMDNI